MRKIEPEEHVMRYFMTASEQDAKVALEKAQLILKTRQVSKAEPVTAKPRVRRDKPQADLQLREPKYPFPDEVEG